VVLEKLSQIFSSSRTSLGESEYFQCSGVSAR